MQSEQTKIMKRKAAVLTWCDNNGPTNYGQILQCYAMQKLVESWGYDSFVVQYRKKDERDIVRHNFSNRNPIGRRLNEYFERRYNLKVIEKENTPRVRQFKKFIREHIRLTPPCYTKEAVEYETRDCELLVCGSDQIWNPIWVNPIWLLDFGTKKQKRVAYAPSGIFYEDEQSGKCYRRMAPFIEKIDVVTVREQLGANILSQYTNKKIQAAPDPTFVLSREEWDAVSSERLIPGNYIFCYIMGSISPYQLVLRKIMEQYGAEKIVYIPSNLVKEGTLPHFQKYEDAGPDRFLSLVKYAKAVCTDSFHGTVLSLLYEKPFFNVIRVQPGAEKFSGAERIQDLLKQLRMPSRTVKNVRDVLENKPIDYEDVKKRRKEICNKAKAAQIAKAGRQ